MLGGVSDTQNIWELKCRLGGIQLEPELHGLLLVCASAQIVHLQQLDALKHIPPGRLLFGIQTMSVEIQSCFDTCLIHISSHTLQIP